MQQCSVLHTLRAKHPAIQRIRRTLNYTYAVNRGPANSSSYDALATAQTLWLQVPPLHCNRSSSSHCGIMYSTVWTWERAPPLSQRQAPDLKKGFVTLMRAIAASLLGPGIAFVSNRFQWKVAAQHKAAASPVNTIFTGAASARVQLPPVLKKVALLSAECQQYLQFHDVSRNRWNRLQEPAVILTQLIFFSLSLSLSRSYMHTSYCILHLSLSHYSIDIYRLHNHMNIFLSAAIMSSALQRLAGQWSSLCNKWAQGALSRIVQSSAIGHATLCKLVWSWIILNLRPWATGAIGTLSHLSAK